MPRPIIISEKYDFGEKICKKNVPRLCPNIIQMRIRIWLFNRFWGTSNNFLQMDSVIHTEQFVRDKMNKVSQTLFKRRCK